jgi:hypothetical protein
MLLIAAGSAKESLPGPNRTTGPYVVCNSHMMVFQDFPNLCWRKNQTSVKDAKKGPGNDLNLCRLRYNRVDIPMKRIITKDSKIAGKAIVLVY